jgi:hypothetical protein
MSATGCAFVGLVHGAARQPHFGHRTEILDEARIRGAAGGGEFRRDRWSRVRTPDSSVDEGPGLVRNATPLTLVPARFRCHFARDIAPRSFRATCAFRLSGVCRSLKRMLKARAPRPGHVRRRIADIECGERQGRGLEMRRAGRAATRASTSLAIARIGMLARFADRPCGPARRDREADLHGAAPADLDRVAGARGRGGFADHAMIETLAFLLQPIEHRLGAVDAGAFLVARDEKADRAFGFAAAPVFGPRRLTNAAMADFMSAAPRP